MVIVWMMAAELALCSHTAAQDNQRQIETGRNIAGLWCAPCHVIGGENQASAVAGPPSFPLLANEGMNEGRLAFALLNPHPAMPKFELSRTAINALASYINSLSD